MTALTTPPASAAEPTPAPRSTWAHASGPVPHRTLLIGGAALLEGSFADAFAREVAGRTGHGVEVEAVLSDAPAPAELLPGRDLSRFDAVVVGLDPRTGTTGDAARALLAELAQRMTVGGALVVLVPSGRPGTEAQRELEAFADDVRGGIDALAAVVVLDDGAAGAERVARRARGVAAVTASRLIDPMVRFLPDDPFDEFARVDAVGPTGHHAAGWAEAFQDLVEAARTTYGTPSAALSIIDDETTRYFARSGNVAVALPRGKTVCNRVMRIFGGLILGDARLDQRFSALPEVKTGDVRFYAGYRITDRDGAPFGALCVFDSSPREVREEDLTALRDLALDAQRRLWELLPAAPTAPAA